MSESIASKPEADVKSLTALSFVPLLLLAWLTAVAGAGQATATTTVRGRISDPFGFPVGGAKVEFVSENRIRRFRAIAGEQGDYSLNNLPAGQYKMSVSSLGFATEEYDVRLWDQESLTLDIGLVAGAADLPPIKVKGTVRQSDNAPLEDATITIANAFNRRLVQNVRTDKQGHYAVSIDNPGQYIISASKAGFIVGVVVKVLPATLPRRQFEADFVLTSLRLP